MSTARSFVLKKRGLATTKATNARRRNFLIRSCQAILAAVVRPRFASAIPVTAPDFHYHPTYRADPPLAALCLKVDAALDDFPAETQHDKWAARLAAWSAEMLQSATGIAAIENTLSPDFLGASLTPVAMKLARPAGALTIHRVAFPAEATLPAAAFLRDFQSSLVGFAKLLTVELQITRIDGDATRVRYELVGTGAAFHREQRVGYWNLEWRDARVRRWKAEEETRSRSSAPTFADITAHALRGSPSYSAQLLCGVDHWRTLLDGACGIDIYGHNGVSVGDIDTDGYDDLYICQPAGLPNRLFRNRRDGTFEDITEASGVGILDNTACALFADFNNNGWQDLLVVRAAGPLLFLNQGNGTFRLKPGAFHFSTVPQGTFTGASTADYNRDGFLDIYFCLYVYYQGADQYKYPAPYYDAENGPPNFLMRNNGDATFSDVTAATGLNKNNTRFSFCCGWSDYNGDGWPDLYVVNDFGRKNLYRNNGDGTFTDIAPQAGVEDVGAGMGVSWFDSAGKGKQDLYVADMWTAAGERISSQPGFQDHSPEPIRALYRKHAMGNSLFRQGPDGAFTDATNAAGVGIGRWAWSTDAWDFDHDGFPDLYVANGMLSGPLKPDLNSFFWRQVVAHSPDSPKPSVDYEQGWGAINELIRADYTWSGFERNVFFVNNRDGTFSDVSGAVGLDFLEDGRAFALADFDRDGRQEVFLKNRNAPQLRILKNTLDPLPDSISFRLRGAQSNRDAIGAVITIGSQTRTLQAGSGFLSQHSKEVFFGLGNTTGSVSATIRWPSGFLQNLQDLPRNHTIWVEEAAPRTRFEPFQSAKQASWLPQQTSPLPSTFGTWLLDPVPAPHVSQFLGKPVLVTVTTQEIPLRRPAGVQLVNLSVNDKTNETATLYNLIYRYLFDRHRDLTLPTSFLIDEKGDIVKVYQGRLDPGQIESDLRRIPKTTAEKLAAALPFPGVSTTYEFGRNHLSYGTVFFQRGYLEQSQQAFRRALKEDPSSAEASYGLGSIDLKMGNDQAAQAAFEETVKLQASYPDTLANAWNNLGLLATRAGKPEEAIRCLEEALRRNPDHFIAQENLGNAYRQQHRWEEARQTLERALAARPQDPEANYSMAMVYAETDRPDLADDYLQRALKVRPSYPEALNNLGVLYLRTHRRDEAVEQFEKCIRLQPDFDRSYLNLARVYSIEGTPEKAREILRQLLKRHPDNLQGKKALEQLP